MAYTDTIRQLPFTPATQNGRGFLPPMVRAMGHILYLTGCLADEDVTVTDEEALGELRAAGEHWNARTPTTATSTAANSTASTLGTALIEALDEYSGWDDEARIQNLRDLSQRMVAYSAALDRELVGLTDSDPGSSL